MRSLTRQHRNVASNGIYLFILTFSNYFLYLLTIPYQTRVLGPDIFGLVGFAMAVAVYFKVLVDFGFMVSATEKVAIQRDEKEKISDILSSVIHAKIWLAVLSACILFVLCLVVPIFRDNYMLFVLFFVGGVAKSFQPDFIYRGIEKMRTITVRTVVVQVFFMIFLFVLVKSPSDILWLAGLEAMGAIVALLFTTIHIHKLGYRVRRQAAKEIMTVLKESIWFFYSRVSLSLYTVTNTIVLSGVYGASSHIIGLYISADRLVTAGKQAITPVGDALYPHMVHKKDFRLMKRVIIIGSVAMLLGCTSVSLYAHEICAIIFGSEYYQAGDYLRILAVAIFFAFPSILLGYPTLSPMGLAKQANISNVIAAILQISQIIFLVTIGQLTVINVCVAYCITEFVVLAYRACVIVWYRSHKGVPSKIK